MFRSGLAALAAIALLGSAGADISNEAISAYNTAAASPDAAVRIAAAKALADEALANPDNEQAALLAYEAAWMMCRSGDCKSAIAPAEFAAGQFPQDAKRALLPKYAAWKDNPKKGERKALDEAMISAESIEPDAMTVSAFQNRYVADMQDGKHSVSRVSALSAAKHFAPAKSEIGHMWASASIAAYASAFNDDQKPDAILGMAEFEADMLVLRHLTKDEPQWMYDAYYTASAWRSAMDAYFQSIGKYEEERQVADELVENALADETHVHEDASTAHADTPDRCTGRITVPPKPKYPRKAASRGYVGAVLVAFDLGEKGVENSRIAAAVPTPIFNDAVLKSMKRVKWEWDEEQENPDCVKDDKNAIYPFHFIIP